MTTADPKYTYGQAEFGEIAQGDQRYLYQQQSHYRDWLFSNEELKRKREEAHERAKGEFDKTVEKEKQARIEKNRMAKEKDPSASPPFDENQVTATYFTLEEERALYQYYEYNIHRLASKHGWSDSVKYTAIVYFKRFYLSNNLMSHSISNVMMTCVFLACKVENFFIPIEEFLKNIPRVGARTILDLEFMVSQSIKFDFAIIHPHRALHGLMLDLQSIESDVQRVLQTYQTALPLLDYSYRTDATFLCPASQVALTAFHIASRTTQLDLTRYLSQFNTPSLLTTLTTLEQLLFPSPLPPYRPDMSLIKNLDRRLILAREPHKDPTSARYQPKPAS